jgi:hypothetical protein
MHQSSRPARPGLRCLATVAAAAVALSPVAVASAAAAAPTRPVPSVAAEQPTAASESTASESTASEFTAAVRSIDHWRGVVTLDGTGPLGGSIGITGDGVDPTRTEIGSDGTWTAAVRVAHGERVLRVTSEASGQAVDVPVELRYLTSPGMIGTVDGIARTITINGTGQAGAHFVIRDNGTTVAETDADADGRWSVTLRGLAFGRHHVEAFQYFDGTQNGGADEVYTVSGAASVTTATASRQTGRVSLAGRAPAGTTLRFADEDGPVLGPDGHPVTATARADTGWDAELPFPTDARFHRITITTHDGDALLGTTEARVTVPIALTGRVEELADGTVRLSGSGENGGVVALEDERGETVRSADGHPIVTTIGRGWELVVPRAVLPDAVVVARQRVDGVEQGAVRLVLPEQPVRPTPDPGDGHDAGVSTGTHPAERPVAAGRTTDGATERLASTGNDPTVPLTIAAALLTAGLGALGVVRSVRRRGGSRG